MYSRGTPLSAFVGLRMHGRALQPPNITCFPAELQLLIFRHTFGNYFDDMEQFVIDRTAALLACVKWYNLVSSAGEFWSSYLIIPYKKTSDVDGWTSRFHHHPLDLRVYLDPMHAFPFDEEDSLGRMDLPASALLAVGLASQCHRLLICADEEKALPLLIPHLEQADGSLLESLTICRIFNVYTDASARLSTPSNLLFGGNLPSLRHLRLTSFNLSWMHLSYYARVIHLVFHQFLEPAIIPTWDQLIRVFGAAPSLSRLSLRHFSCGPPPPGAPGICFISLLELDMCFCGENTLEFLSRCDFPCLTALSAHFHRSADVETLIGCTSMFPSLTYFCPSGDCHSGGAAGVLLQLMPSLLRLNLSDASPVFLDAVTMHDDQGVVCCPRLRDLSIADCSLAEIQVLISRRMSTADRLALLSIHELQGTVTEQGISWIRARVDKLRVDPEFDFHDDWVFHRAD
ncbi:hypothetical protein FB451DRAFT_1411451 [Mycena latifolia]|nr:hypothetical protein FB451DRAFT_1411451 [Mycena latifolia]